GTSGSAGMCPSRLPKASTPPSMRAARLSSVVNTGKPGRSSSVLSKCAPTTARRPSSMPGNSARKSSAMKPASASASSRSSDKRFGVSPGVNSHASTPGQLTRSSDCMILSTMKPLQFTTATFAPVACALALNQKRLVQRLCCIIGKPRKRFSATMETMSRRVAVIGGTRIPFCRHNTAYAEVGNFGMSVKVLGALVERFGLHGRELGEVAFGAVIKQVVDWNLAREALLSSGLAPTTPGITTARACGTSLDNAIIVANKIATGQIDAGIAGGSDTTSDVPITYSRR